MATAAAYGSPWARSRFTAAAVTYAIATATLDPSHICDLHHSSEQHQILNPLSKVRDQTHILMDTSQVCNTLSHNSNSYIHFPLLCHKLAQAQQLEIQPSVTRGSGSRWLGPLLRISQAEVKLSAGLQSSSEAYDPLLCSLALGRIHLLVAVAPKVTTFLPVSWGSETTLGPQRIPILPCHVNVSLWPPPPLTVCYLWVLQNSHMTTWLSRHQGRVTTFTGPLLWSGGENNTRCDNWTQEFGDHLRIQATSDL